MKQHLTKIRSSYSIQDTRYSILNTRHGFTLIETLLYIAIFSFVMTGTLLASYQIIQSSDTLSAHTTLQEEMGFVIRKIEWAIVQAETADIPDPQTLDIDSGALVFTLDGTTLVLNSTPLTTENVSVADLPIFSEPTPGEIQTEITFSHLGTTRSATSIKYVR